MRSRFCVTDGRCERNLRPCSIPDAPIGIAPGNPVKTRGSFERSLFRRWHLFGSTTGTFRSPAGRRSLLLRRKDHRKSLARGRALPRSRMPFRSSSPRRASRSCTYLPRNSITSAPLRRPPTGKPASIARRIATDSEAATESDTPDTRKHYVIVRLAEQGHA